MHHTAEHRAQILVPGIQPHFNRIPDEGDIRLTKVQLFAGGHTLLEFDETDRLPRTRAMPSVTPCSTWIRGLTSRKYGLPC